MLKASVKSGPVDDVLIIGAGLAGLFLALRLSPRPCTIISPSPLGTNASSAWAQGGLAAALDPQDSPAAHAADTVAAGAGLVDPIMAHLIAKDGPARILDLLELGVPFDRTPKGALALSLEAAHSRPRIARVAGDLAGQAIMQALTQAARQSPSIHLIENAKAVSLLQDAQGRISGVITQDTEARTSPRLARETVLSTGGLGGLYSVTTNPASAKGDALAMAAEAGALLSDTEFVQFHPTALDVGLDPAPLATEALRGAGARLCNKNGMPFMSAYHSDAELAPRDVVARAIELERASGRGAFLDARIAIGADFETRFPTVFDACQKAGFDPREKLMPIAPAAHYHMGGIVSDSWGRASLDGLSVCGECASTGLHGANRLASNSLLEAVVFAERIAQRLKGDRLADPKDAHGNIPRQLPPSVFQALRVHMSKSCGIVRHGEGLADFLNWLAEMDEAYGPNQASLVARLIAEPALAREESRGGHHRLDYPDSLVPMRSYIQYRQGHIHIDKG